MESGPERIERLLGLGAVRKREAQQWIRALEYHDRLREVPNPGFWLRVLLHLRPAVPTPDKVNVALFLAGRIELREYRKKEALFALGFLGILVLFTIALGTLGEWLDRGRPPTFSQGATLLGKILLMTLASGFLLCGVTWVTSFRMARLRRLLDKPPEGLRDPP